LVAEVSFGEWTESGHIRHAAFRGLRSDKSAADIERETPIRATQADTQDEPARRPRRSAAKGKAPSSTRLTHPDRVIDPSTGSTKLDVARYYGLVAPLLLEHLKGRPVAFLRAPQGIEGQHFFQKHWWGVSMSGVQTLPASLDPGHPALMEVSSADGIMSASQMNVIEFHTWNAVKASIAKPDRILFDLDPGEGVQWPTVRQAAELVRVLLRELGLQAWLKTSGGKGLHVDVPIRKQYGWDDVKGFAGAVVQHLADAIPAIFVAKSGPRNRVGKIYVDYLRNGFGATTVAAWSLRARPGMGVSVPVAWDEVGTLRSSAQWHIGNVHERLDRGNEPWRGYGGSARALAAAMKTLGFKPGK
jgi:bifunctional non-homologous end joining protein LigD